MNGQTDRHTELVRQIDRHEYLKRQTDEWTDRQIHTQMGRHIDKYIDSVRHKQI
jgi:hypothetical protein